mmetsp:Transcript_37846/g.103225  ORF Transcript_37846/g.103225 Transcript_37846/m.103225 type:complete len:199 (-) Transcript_37846:17-613(-)
MLRCTLPRTCPCAYTCPCHTFRSHQLHPTNTPTNTLTSKLEERVVEAKKKFFDILRANGWPSAEAKTEVKRWRIWAKARPPDVGGSWEGRSRIFMDSPAGKRYDSWKDLERMYQRQNLPPRGKDKSGKRKLWTGPHEPIPERQRAPAVVTTATYCAATGVSLPPVAPFLAKLREQLTVTCARFPGSPQFRLPQASPLA